MNINTWTQYRDIGIVRTDNVVVLPFAGYSPTPVSSTEIRHSR